MAYRWTGPGELRRVGGANIAEGETFDPTESELESFAASIEPVDSDDTAETASEDTDTSEDPDYAAMDYAELRQLAVDADTDEIDGRSKKDEIIAYFEG
jgi:hypothetical protein